MFTINAAFLPYHVYAQSANELDENITKYPGKKAVDLFVSEHVDIINNKKGVKLLTEYYEETILLDEYVSPYAENSIPLNSFDELLSFKAFTLVPQDNRYLKVPVKNFSTINKWNNSVFYDDFESKYFIYPSLQKGCKTVLSYKTSCTEPHMFGSFYFASGKYVAKSQFSVSFPDNMVLGYKIFGDQNQKIKFSSSQKGEIITYTWTSENIEEYKSEDNSPSFVYTIPHIIVFIEKYYNEGKTVQVYSSLNLLYEWYLSLVNSQAEDDEEDALRQFTDSLVMNIKDEESKIKELFYWTQDNIKYIAFEDKYNGLVPRPAGKVWSKRYGDCKDMANLLVKMLKMAGVKAYITWVGTHDLPYKYTELPTLHVDNHMIAAVVDSMGRYTFLDPTAGFCSLGYPGFSTQGKEALISISDTSFEVKEIPVVPMQKNLVIDSVFLSVSGDSLKGTGKYFIDGYPKFKYALMYGPLNNEDLKKSLNILLLKGNNKFSLTGFNPKGKASRDSVFSIDYSFVIPSYISQTKDEIFINLNLEKIRQEDIIDLKDRKAPFYRPFKFKEKYVFSLDIPKGSAIKYLPENKSYNNEFGGFSITYTAVNDKVILVYDYYSDFLFAQKDNLNKWNELIMALREAFRQTIILKKTY